MKSKPHNPLLFGEFLNENLDEWKASFSVEVNRSISLKCRRNNKPSRTIGHKINRVLAANGPKNVAKLQQIIEK
jgi:hypothetical protein